MQNNHTRFILSSIANILEDAVSACSCISDGIEAQALCEYVLQTTFLKMTGALEQKLKCICWEMASNDYDYRYIYLKKKYGECSSYEEKNSIYKDILSLISKYDESFVNPSLFDDIDITSEIEKYINEELIPHAIKNQEKKQKAKLTIENREKMIRGMKNYFNKKGLCVDEIVKLQKKTFLKNEVGKIKYILQDSVFPVWKQRDYNRFIHNWDNICSYDFATNVLFDDCMQINYDIIVYAHRNRCAHNLMSYQNNLPTLRNLMNPNYEKENYFFRFFMLFLLDEIFMRLYKRYLRTLNTVF